MALFAFDIVQDWTSTEFLLYLWLIAPFLLVYIAAFAILGLVRRRRKKRLDPTINVKDEFRLTRRST